MKTRFLCNLVLKRKVCSYIAYVRTGGGGSEPMRTHCVQGGGGVKNRNIFAYVLYGRPLRGCSNITVRLLLGNTATFLQPCGIVAAILRESCNNVIAATSLSPRGNLGNAEPTCL